MCVQRFDDSLASAIHITYRISLRSSSMREPRDPLLKVVSGSTDYKENRDEGSVQKEKREKKKKKTSGRPEVISYASAPDPSEEIRGIEGSFSCQRQTVNGCTQGGYGFDRPYLFVGIDLSNDPSAGSPTETLLRLLLPLNDQVCPTSQRPAAVASCRAPIRGAH